MKLKFRADKKDFVIFLILLVVLFFAVAIGVIQINSFATTGELRTLNIFRVYYEEKYYDNDTSLLWLTIIFYIGILAAIMMSCSSYFFESLFIV